MDVTSPVANYRYNRITKALEWPMALLALAVIPALLLDNGSAEPAGIAHRSAAVSVSTDDCPLERIERLLQRAVQRDLVRAVGDVILFDLSASSGVW